MTAPRPANWAGHSMRITACGLGTVLGGPLGGALGGWLGDAFGPSTVELIRRYAEKFSEGAATKLLDIGADSLAGESGTPSSQLGAVYCEALRLALRDICSRVSAKGFADWFDNWDRCLAGHVAVDFSEFKMEQVAAHTFDGHFRRVMELLDGQGAAMLQNDLSLNIKCRSMPDALLTELNARLPGPLEKYFRRLILAPKYEQAWKEKLVVFEKSANNAMEQIDKTTQEINRKTDVLLDRVAVLEQSLKAALQEGRVSPQQVMDKE